MTLPGRPLLCALVAVCAEIHYLSLLFSSSATLPEQIQCWCWNVKQHPKVCNLIEMSSVLLSQKESINSCILKNILKYILDIFQESIVSLEAICMLKCKWPGSTNVCNPFCISGVHLCQVSMVSLLKQNISCLLHLQNGLQSCMYG